MAKGFTKEQRHHIIESVRAGSFAKEWWKQLTKTINRLDLSKRERIMVYVRVARGLIEESWKLSDEQDDKFYIYNEIIEDLHSYIEEDL